MRRDILEIIIAVLVASSPMLLATGCSKAPKPDEQPTEQQNVDPDAWRDRVVALDVTGFQFAWDGTKPKQWNGTGYMVGPGLMVTNAHVVMRAEAIEGRTDTGEKVTFSRIKAVDLDNDLALVSTAGTDELGDINMVSRPDDPLSMRETEVSAAGYTGGGQVGEISLYSGRITTISTLDAEHERILHDAEISKGASGGPLLNTDKTNLLGINHAISYALKFSVAIPSWTVEDFVETNRDNEGLKIEDFFTDAQSLKYNTLHARRLCLKPGDLAKFPIDAQQDDDMLFSIVSQSDAPLFVAVMVGEEIVVRELVTGQNIRALTSPKAGSYTVVLASHPAVASDEQCADFEAARIDWENRE